LLDTLRVDEVPMVCPAFRIDRAQTRGEHPLPMLFDHSPPVAISPLPLFDPETKSRRIPLCRLLRRHGAKGNGAIDLISA
jgi:hypothetical protein